MFTPGQWDSLTHSEEVVTAVSPNAGTQQGVGATLMDVVNGEIVMVEGEGSKKSRASRKRPAEWMPDSSNINMSSSSSNNNNNNEEEEEQQQPQPLSGGSSDQLLPIGSRMGLTESGSWAHSWGGAAQKFDHKNCGGEYNFSTVGMAPSGQYSSPGFHQHSPPLSNMAPVDCGGRLKRATYVGGGMVGASSARFHGGFSSGMAATIMPSLHTTSPMSSGASFRATTTTTTTTTASLMTSTGSLTPPVCSTSKELPSSPIISTGDGSILGHGGSGGGQHLARHLHRIQRKFSAMSFDQEMANYESQVAQIASENIVRLLPARSMSRPEERILVQEGGRQSSQFVETRSGLTDLSLALRAAPQAPNSKRLAAAAAGGGKSGSTGKGLLATCALGSPSVGEESKLGLETSSVSTQSLQNPGDVKVFTWIEPLKFLLRKGLTVSDVGELGRVILPKKDAECHLPQMDSKEGILMAMVDHDCTRQWVFRYKWWLNNKSRMFVLENTGDFMRYHDLKEKDAMTLYKDGVGTMVIHGEKTRNALTTQQISSVGKALVRDSHNENLTCHVKPNSLPAAIALEILTLTKSNNPSPRAEDLPSSASASATETMADATPDYTDERLNDPDPNLNWDFGNTSA